MRIMIKGGVWKNTEVRSQSELFCFLSLYDHQGHVLELH